MRNRRNILHAFLGAGLLVGAFDRAALARPTDDTHPNIVYILADDLGIGDVSCYNESAAWQTVHMDRLAAEGIRFNDAHSGSAVCTPTRYGILTGRYAWRSRLARGVLGGTSRHLIDPQRMTVARFLQQNGYYTGCIGKWHLGWDWAHPADKPREIDFGQPVTNGPSANGFDYYLCHSGSLDMPPYVYVENDRVTAAPNRTTVNHDEQQLWREGLTGADFDHAEVLEVFTKKAVEFIHEQAKRDKPFLLYLALPAPHTPILPTGEFLGKSGTNVYGDFTLQVDSTVGRVMQALVDAGEDQRTVLIFTSDNGCSPRADFDELAMYGHKPSLIYRGHKADIFEGGHRIAFVVRWPGRVKAGTESDQTICLTDLMRTCADILGKELPDNAAEDSTSFLPVLDGENLSEPLRESTVHHSINGSFAIRSGKWKLAFCPGSGGWSDPKPKVARDRGLPPRQLFDLDADPAETVNVADQHPEIVARMTQLLDLQVTEGRSTAGQRQDNDRKVRFLPQSSRGQ